MSQNQKILDYMRLHGSITPLDAMLDIGCMRLAARISDLKRDGHRIKSEQIKVPTRDGSTYVASYSLEE